MTHNSGQTHGANAPIPAAEMAALDTHALHDAELMRLPQAAYYPPARCAQATVVMCQAKDKTAKQWLIKSSCGGNVAVSSRLECAQGPIIVSLMNTMSEQRPINGGKITILSAISNFCKSIR